jgi:hypothetical protein
MIAFEAQTSIAFHPDSGYGGGLMSDKSCTETLNLGDIAPAFKLAAANRQESVGLGSLLADGPVIVEFLRGTW